MPVNISHCQPFKSIKMKQHIQILAATLFFVLGVSCLGQAQKVDANSNEQTYNTGITENRTDNNITTNTALKSVLVTLFPAATEQQWCQNATGNYVSFLNDGRKASASFSVKGKLNYAIIECDGNQLPKDFGRIITQNYPSYSLFHATKIIAHGETAYQAIVENAKGFITLRYTTDGLEEIQKVKK